MFLMEKTMIVVYKDEMIANQLKKMVETNNKNEDREYIINIVAWNEKVWLANKMSGNIKDKVLFIGDIKDTDKLIPVIDEKFNDCGVKYGWAGNQAIVYADLKEVGDKDKYDAFYEKLTSISLPETIKENKNINILDNILPLISNVFENNEEGDEEKSNNILGNNLIVSNVKDNKFFRKALDGIQKGADIASKAGAMVAEKTEVMLRDKKTIMQQMLFFGIVNLCNNDLEEFMNK